MRRFLVDANVFLYAVGAEHPYREPCREAVDRMRRRLLAPDASVEMVQEFAHVRMRRTRRRGAALREARAVAALCRLHDFRGRDLDLALRLAGRHEAIDLRDAVYAGTALANGIDAILSADRDFDPVEGLDRIDPADEAAVAALSA